MTERVVSAAPGGDDAQFEAGLRPRRLDDYIGQDRVRENLEVSIAAARQRGEALDHILLWGPPGLGKTTLAYVIANEMGAPIRTTSGPVIEKPGDLAGMLSGLQNGEVLFIDEIHRMPATMKSRRSSGGCANSRRSRRSNSWGAMRHWQSWSAAERKHFGKRLMTLWNVHRHRMAPQIAACVAALQKEGRLHLVKAGVRSVASGPTINTANGPVVVDAVINCLGYRYDEEGRAYIVGERIGPARFGELFETTAIPEIRAQAHALAAALLP